MTFFGTTTLEMWPHQMFRVAHVVGEDKVLDMKNSEGMNKVVAYVLYITFIVLVILFWLNILVSVILKKFRQILERKAGPANFKNIEKEWVKMNC